MAIAMKDLEIRGAGNLLGGEQSGHIADVGFDLYVRLVGEAVGEFRQAQSPGWDGTQPEALQEMRIEIPIDAHLPHGYIGSERLRLEMYKRLSEVRSDDDVALLREEMLDRYGEPPPEVARLLEVARFRGRARKAGLTEVQAQGKFVRFAPVELPDSAVVRLNRLHPKSVVKAGLRTMLVPRPLSGSQGGPPRDEELLAWARKVIDTVIDPAGAQQETALS
jgi:transcription-repair coupling factor (superfamily II helicase)